MSKLIAIVLLIVGLVFGGLAYSYYSESTIANNRARFYSDNPTQAPPTLTGETRDQYIAAELRSAERNRNMAMLSGFGSLILIASGAALLIFSVGRGKLRVPLNSFKIKLALGSPVPGPVLHLRDQWPFSTGCFKRSCSPSFWYFSVGSLF